MDTNVCAKIREAATVERPASWHPNHRRIQMQPQSISVCSVGNCSLPTHARGYCDKHYKRWQVSGEISSPRDQTVAERFWAKVDKNGPTPVSHPDLGPCWLWTASGSKGDYGHFWLDGRYQPSHRVAYEWDCGAIAAGLTLDHLCVNPPCVRPSHMEPVSMQENLLRGNTFQSRNARKTHCDHGHAFDLFNTGVDKRGRRFCLTCRRSYT